MARECLADGAHHSNRMSVQIVANQQFTNVNSCAAALSRASPLQAGGRVGDGKESVADAAVRRGDGSVETAAATANAPAITRAGAKSGMSAGPRRILPPRNLLRDGPAYRPADAPAVRR